MPKAFLSHSSKQKDFVEEIALQLSTSAVIDSKSFEEGLKNAEEIISFINVSDLFVLFLSDSALNSDWVIKELEHAKLRLDQNKIARIYPLIIDHEVSHSDPRIPEWLKVGYNLKPVLRVGKAVRLIKRRLKEISWNNHPKLKERDTVFVGRNDQIRTVEERFDDLFKPNPLVLIASGITKIGRKTFLKHSLIKNSSISKESYDFPIITMSNRESVEDFIIKVYDLGFSNEIDFPDLLETSLDAKVDIVLNLLLDCQSLNEIILVEDTGGIILHDRTIVPWFFAILKKWQDVLKNQITICIASQFKASYKVLVGYNDLFQIEISELSKIESAGLLKRLSILHNIDIIPEDLSFINENLNGFPEQVHYCVDLLSEIGIKSLKKDFLPVKEYQKNIFNKIVEEIEENKDYKNALNILVEFDFISLELLYEILSDVQESEVDIIVESLIGRSIIEYIGTNKEYIRLNQGIKDFLLRAGYTLSSKYKEKLKKHIEDYLKTTNFVSSDISDFFYSLKGALLGDYNFKNKLLLPSHYLKTMIKLYEQDRNYNDVVIIADKILEKESRIDLSIVYEIRYWLCLALARKKNERLKSEVRFFNGADHQFLLGFYYRISGQAEFALERYEAALLERPRFSRAQRELVRVLTYLELYNEALQHAEINYENDKGNPYHIQAYFDCLIRRTDSILNQDKIRGLLDRLEAINTRKAKEMAALANADFALFINNDKTKALKLVNQALEDFNQSPYLLYKKFVIAEKARNIFEMGNTILKYEKEKVLKGDNWNEKNTLYIMKAKFEAHKGNKPKAIDIINNKLSFIPQQTKEVIIKSIEYI